MFTDAFTMTDTTALTTADHERAVGQMANQYAAANSFTDYNSRKADNTLRAHAANLETFAGFLVTVGFVRDGDALQHEPQAWAGVTYGLVEAFRNWLVQQGYAISTVNLKLSSVKSYAKLAAKAGTLDATEQILIASVTGYSVKEAGKVDSRRETARIGHKKAEHTAITTLQAETLKSHPDTPQGRRDSVLMGLLLDHGLRASEVAALTVESINLDDKSMSFHRPKVAKSQTHSLTSDTQQALRAYFDAGDAPETGLLLRGSRKSGTLTHAGMTVGNISMRVKKLGADIGIEQLSAHDCRHYWATYWAKRVDRLPKGLFSLQEAGGWSSLVMPRRYVEVSAIANEGMG